MFNVFSLIGAIGLTALSGGLSVKSLNPRKSISVNETEGLFSINFDCTGLLDEDLPYSMNINGSYAVISSYHYWAGTGIEMSGTQTYTGVSPLSLKILQSSNLSYANDTRYYAVVDNFVVRKTSNTYYFLMMTRQYVMFNYFNDKNFTYGVRNYGGYADNICTIVHDTLSDFEDTVYMFHQGFISYHDAYEPNFFSWVYDESQVDGEVYLYGLYDLDTNIDSIHSVGSYNCPFNEFNGRNYNVRLKENVYAYVLPYYYILGLTTDDNSYQMNFQQFLDYFVDINWSWSFYGSTNSSNSYTEGFTDGQSSGYTNGYNIGYEDGSVNGYDNGYNTGYDAGKTAGIAESNNYTFLGLFGAIADTPVLMIRSLFDFDFFGVNLLSVVLSLFTGLILFYLLRKLL